MNGSPAERALREILSDLIALGDRAERLDMELVASLIRMAILDVEAALSDEHPTRLDS